MAEALSDDSELNNSATAIAAANYPGPRSDVQYPLTIQYCGGSFIELISKYQ